MRLLLVEDHAELAEWVARTLRQGGFVLDVLGRGDHADQALRTERYDLVIGADGLYSKVRKALFPEAPAPQYSGQAVWRAVLPRPPEIETITMWMGPQIKPGVNPVSQTEMYLFVTEPKPVNDHVDPATFVDRLKGLLDGFSADLAASGGSLLRMPWAMKFTTSSRVMPCWCR